MKGFSPESNIAGGEVMSRLGGQFKQIPTKIIEQFIDRARYATSVPDGKKKLLRAAAGAGIAFEGAKAGFHTFHLNPGSLMKSTILGPAGDALSNIYNDVN